MSSHALLSASSAHRWINCPPSARLCEQMEDRPSAYAAEGTDAHALCEHKLKAALGVPTQDPTPTLAHYDADMEEHACGYADYVLGRVEEARRACADPVVLVEQRVDFSRWVEGGFGTADCVIVADGTLQVIDFKYGLGVLVDAKGNEQMRCYALGAMELFEGIYDIDRVSMTIYQPRRDHLSTETIGAAELHGWAESVLRPAAELAIAGEGELSCGQWCGFCKAKATCRARAEANLELARHEFRLPPLLSDEDVEDILPKLDGLASWASDIKDYALKRALSGKEWAGFKVVEGRSNRRYVDDAAAAEAVSGAGFDPYEKRLLGITAMQKMLGKRRFDEVLGDLVEKPQGKPALVPLSDKRPPMNNAKDDFNDNDTEGANNG